MILFCFSIDLSNIAFDPNYALFRVTEGNIMCLKFIYMMFFVLNIHASHRIRIFDVPKPIIKSKETNNNVWVEENSYL